MLGLKKIKMAPENAKSAYLTGLFWRDSKMRVRLTQCISHSTEMLTITTMRMVAVIMTMMPW